MYTWVCASAAKWDAVTFLPTFITSHYLFTSSSTYAVQCVKLFLAWAIHPTRLWQYVRGFAAFCKCSSINQVAPWPRQMLREQLVSAHISLMFAVTGLYCKAGKHFQLITKCIFVCIPLLLPNYKMCFFTLLVLFNDSLPALHMTNLSQTKIKGLVSLEAKNKNLLPRRQVIFPPWRNCSKKVQIWSK